MPGLFQPNGMGMPQLQGPQNTPGTMGMPMGGMGGQQQTNYGQSGMSPGAFFGMPGSSNNGYAMTTPAQQPGMGGMSQNRPQPQWANRPSGAQGYLNNGTGGMGGGGFSGMPGSAQPGAAAGGIMSPIAQPAQQQGQQPPQSPQSPQPPSPLLAQNAQQAQPGAAQSPAPGGAPNTGVGQQGLMGTNQNGQPNWQAWGQPNPGAGQQTWDNSSILAQNANPYGSSNYGQQGQLPQQNAGTNPLAGNSDFTQTSPGHFNFNGGPGPASFQSLMPRPQQQMGMPQQQQQQQPMAPQQQLPLSGAQFNFRR